MAKQRKIVHQRIISNTVNDKGKWTLVCELTLSCGHKLQEGHFGKRLEEYPFKSKACYECK